MQKHLKVLINGKQYSVATDENDQDIYYAAQLVDTLLKNMAEKLPGGNDERAALVVALQLATDFAKAQNSLKSCEQRVEQLLSLLTYEA